MSRLVKAQTHEDDGQFAAAGENPVKVYAENVAKFVPSEIVGGYLAINGFIPAAPPKTQFPLALGVAVLCLVLTPIYLWQLASPGDAKKTQMIVSTIAFVVWAYAVGVGVFGPGFLNWYNAAIASIILVVFTLISGVIPRKS